MKIVRAAVVQDSPVVFDQDSDTGQDQQANCRSCRQGEPLSIVSRSFRVCISKRTRFRRPSWYAFLYGREDFLRYFESAVVVPGKATQFLGDAAKKHGVYLVIGVIEQSGYTLYCTVLFFSPQGQLLGKHRKLMPTAMERLVWGFGDGSTMPVFDTPMGKIGAVICWENYMPLLETYMYSKGIEFYCAPTADDGEYVAPFHAAHRIGGSLFRFVLLPVSA